VVAVVLAFAPGAVALRAVAPGAVGSIDEKRQAEQRASSTLFREWLAA
jgi:hypothetical protein